MVGIIESRSKTRHASATDETHNGLFLHPRRRRHSSATKGTIGTIVPTTNICNTTPPATEAADPDSPEQGTSDYESSLVPSALPESTNSNGPRRQQEEDENNNLYVTDSWLFKGIKEYVGDLHLSRVDGDEVVAVEARSKVEVLCEYTFIKTTPSQRSEAEMLFPAVYVPGNAHSWKTIRPRTKLNQGHPPPAVMSDEHHARQPTFPYEPTLRALLAATQQQQQHENGNSSDNTHAHDPPRRAVNMRAVEIFTDAHVLGQLFAFVSAPQQAHPFRLELSTVRNTLFLEAGRHHGQGHTKRRSCGRGGGGVEHEHGDMPAWAPDAFRKAGAEAPRLPFSGGHYRVLRYRVGNMVCAVRSQVAFVHDSRKRPSKATFDPLVGVRPETIVSPPKDNDTNMNEDNDEEIQTWRTTVKNLGTGTKPDQAGKATLRFAEEDYDGNNGTNYSSPRRRRLLTTELPLLWFSRTTYLVEAVVSQDLTVLESKLRCISGGTYRAWEGAHQTDLRKLAALLHKMKQITRDMGGACVLVGDPGQKCFMVMEPVIKKWPVPEEVALQLWGSAEDGAAETEYESTAASKSSDLSTLRSQTPSGFEDWGLGEKGAGRWRQQQQQARKGVTSRALVTRWLGQSQPIGLAEDVKFDIDEISSDELTPNDSQSQRSGEVSSDNDDDDDEDEDDEDDDDEDEEDDIYFLRYGADGAFAHDELELRHSDRIVIDGSDESNENGYRYGYASDEESPSQDSESSDGDSMDVDADEGGYEYSYADDEEGEEDEDEDDCVYPSIEYDGYGYDGEYDDEDEVDGYDQGEDDIETQMEQGASRTKLAARPVDTEDAEDAEMCNGSGSNCSSRRSSRPMIDETYRRYHMQGSHPGTGFSPADDDAVQVAATAGYYP